MQMEQPRRALSALESYQTISIDSILDSEQEPDVDDRALALFHDVAGRVAAYRAFLSEHGIGPATVRKAAPPIAERQPVYYQEQLF